MATPRWFAPAVLAAALGAAAWTPAPAQAQSADLLRSIVDIADVVMRGNQPYYRHGNYGANDRLVMTRDRYGRPVYQRVSADRYGDQDRYGYGRDRNDRYDRDDRYDRSAPPYGRAYGYHNQRATKGTKCNRNGKCKTEYYDERYDERRSRGW